MTAYLCDPKKNTSCPRCGTMFCATKDIDSCEFTTKKEFAWINPKTGKPITIDIISGDDDGINGNINISALAKIAALQKGKVVIGTPDALMPGKPLGEAEGEPQPEWEVADHAIKGLDDVFAKLENPKMAKGLY